MIWPASDTNQQWTWLQNSEYVRLIQWGRVMHKYFREMGHHWSRHWLVTNCPQDINRTSADLLSIAPLENIFQWNFNSSTIIQTEWSCKMWLRKWRPFNLSLKLLMRSQRGGCLAPTRSPLIGTSLCMPTTLEIHLQRNHNYEVTHSEFVPLDNWVCFKTF